MDSHNKLLSIVISGLFLLLSFFSLAEVRLPQLIGNGMVIQRDTKLKIWGWASPQEKVSVSFNGKKITTTTGPDGKWLLVLPAMPTGGPFTMKIKGSNEIILTDILIGDVWFSSGQSNMVLTMGDVKERYPDGISNANYTQIRSFFVPTKGDVTTTHDDMPPGSWVAVNPQTVLKLSAVSYFFAKALYLKHHVPVGIISSSVNGSPAEAWVSAEGLRNFPAYELQIKNFRDTAFMNSVTRNRSSNQVSPGIGADPDKGIIGEIPWHDTTYVAKGWRKLWLPGYWADQGIKDLNGTVWFRKEINVPASMIGKDAKLSLGRIVDTDVTYVNGVKVGSSGSMYNRRSYSVSGDLLKPGKNIIVIKVTNNFGKGGFVPDMGYSLSTGDQTIDLRGDWSYQVGQVFSRLPVAKATSVLFSPQNSPTALYNTMVNPAVNYAIKGFIWYQGESNVSRAKEYETLFPSLIADWRGKWNLGNLPFIYVQLPNFLEVNYSPSESQWAELRESQRKSLSVLNTGMAVTFDSGEWNDLHPFGKKVIGERMALWAEHLAYGDNKLAYSGPIYQSAKAEGNKVILSFNTIGELKVRGGGELYYFAIAGEDKRYVWAKATIEANKVVVWSDAVKNPLYVKYAWADNPEGANLINSADLLASPFEASVVNE